MKIIDYPDRDMLVIDMANRLAEDLETHLINHDQASIALSGGNTPGPIFDVLCAADLDWARVRVMPSDERWVPDGHERSNAKLIRDRLLVNRAAGAELVSFHGNGPDPEPHMEALNARIAPALPISIVMLGMGPDMHTASLFPGSPELAAGLDPHAPALVAQTPPSQDEKRISLSARAINDALNKHLIITGADKRDALERALSLPPEEAPVNSVLNGITVHWAP